jgi:hypothetical protein
MRGKATTYPAEDQTTPCQGSMVGVTLSVGFRLPRFGDGPGDCARGGRLFGLRGRRLYRPSSCCSK